MAKKDNGTEEVHVRPGAPLDQVAAQLGQESAQERAETELGGNAQDQTPAPRRGRPAGTKTGQGKGRSRSRAAAPRNAAPQDNGPPAAQLREMEQQQIGVFANIIQLSFGAIISRRFPKQPYTREEAEALATAALPVMDKYGDTLVVAYKEEIALVVCVAMQVMPRVQAENADMQLPQPTGVNISEIVENQI